MISAALAMLENDDQRRLMTDFYKANKNGLYRFAFSRLNSREAAEDAVQETFLRIAKYPKKFFEIDAHKRVPYAVIIIRNVIADILTSTSRQHHDELTVNIADDGLSMEEMVEGRISGEELASFIEQMSPAKKEAISLRVVYEMSNEQIADVLGISLEAVRRRISDAYKAINEFLERKE